MKKKKKKIEVKRHSYIVLERPARAADRSSQSSQSFKVGEGAEGRNAEGREGERAEGVRQSELPKGTVSGRK